MERDQITNEEIIKVLHKNAGLLSPSSKKLKISRRTLYRWIDADDELKEELKSCREAMIDYSESKLYKNIKEGKETSIIFHLKTLGKDRGYIEKSEHAIHVEQPLFEDDEDDDN